MMASQSRYGLDRRACRRRDPCWSGQQAVAAQKFAELERIICATPSYLERRGVPREACLHCRGSIEPSRFVRARALSF
jgi:hypothetical protein